MTQTLDLLKIAQEEQNGDLFKLLDGIYKRSKIQPRGFTDAAVGMFGKRWAAIWLLGALWTLPESFMFAYSLIGHYFDASEFLTKARLFPRLGSDLVKWWMLYPWWSQRAMGLFWVLKLLISFPCNVFTAMMFFGGLSAYLSPKAQLPDDLLVDAGRVVDLKHRVQAEAAAQTER